MPKARPRNLASTPLRATLSATALVGMCGVLALATRIEAEQPTPPASEVKLTLPPAEQPLSAKGFVFEGGAYSPSAPPSNSPRDTPTAAKVTQQQPQQIYSEVVFGGEVRRAPARESRTVEAETPRRPQRSAPKKRAAQEDLGDDTPRSTPRTAPRARFREEAPALRPEEREDKEVKEVAPLVEPLSPVTFTGSAGYYSRYMFRGLDVGYRTGIDSGNDSGFFSTSAALSYKGFALGFAYTESLDSYVPAGSAFNRDFGNPDNPLDFRAPSRERYKEYDLFANYTLNITDTLSLTAGLNFYWFGDSRSWANSGGRVSNTIETATILTYSGLPYVTQSLGYYYDFDAFKGSYLEYKIAAKPLKIYEEGKFSVSLIPNATVSYDFRYNGSNNGWNSFEPAIDVPVQITDGLTLNLSARYNMDLGDSSGNGQGGFVDRTDDRFWFTAAVQYTFPNAGWNQSLPYYGKDKDAGKTEIIMPTPEFKWDLQVGAGIRAISSDFHLRPTNPLRFTDGLAAGGTFGFATLGQDAIYADGAVFAGSRPFNFGAVPDGTAPFAYFDQSQISDPGVGRNRTVTFHSERFLASESSGFGADQRDDDEPIYPFLTLSRELLRQNAISVSAGVGYQYARSESDSGYRQTGVINNTTRFFTYDFDELFSNVSANPQAPFNNLDSPLFFSPVTNYFVIYDPAQYQAVYDGPGSPFGTTVPLPARQSSEGRALAAFSRATLDTDLHSISIPINIKYDVMPRVHVGVSFGPTFNVFDLDLKTETNYQLVQFAQPPIEFHRSPFNPATGQPVTVGYSPQGGTKPPSTPNANARPAAVAAAAGGGKGAVGAKSRNLPGQNIARETHRRNSQEFEVGVFGQASISIDLDAAKRWYVEVYARYDYVPEFEVSDGSTSVDIDASSFGGGVGIGFRF